MPLSFVACRTTKQNNETTVAHRDKESTPKSLEETQMEASNAVLSPNGEKPDDSASGESTHIQPTLHHIEPVPGSNCIEDFGILTDARMLLELHQSVVRQADKTQP